MTTYMRKKNTPRNKRRKVAGYTRSDGVKVGGYYRKKNTNNARRSVRKPLRR